MATFTKLRDGSWGIKLGAADMTSGRSGAVVSVKTKAGEVKRVTIAKVLSKGSDYALCSIISDRPRPDPHSGEGRSQRSTEALYKRKYGWDGKRGSSSYYSSGMYDEES